MSSGRFHIHAFSVNREIVTVVPSYAKRSMPGTAIALPRSRRRSPGGTRHVPSFESTCIFLLRGGCCAGGVEVEDQQPARTIATSNTRIARSNARAVRTDVQIHVRFSELVSGRDNTGSG